MGFWQRIAINSLVFIALQYMMQGFIVSSVWTALIASIVLAFLNVLVKPVLSLLSFPITLLTFGLFSFVINALMLSLTSVLVGSGFYFSNFGTALLVSLVLSLVQSFISDRKRY
ncbi:phage holin family protein [Jeotgalibaca sp. MA1X17-3]|uniref:phage holin family protein n=1 Tax=Jeotgalibaca sp. MA1X17-3 TaxID=2908211 RepID=UPI001F417874|nr:phage holin family protein [Jeotgalibaca sp. MA1X17-3]UJF15492.1 phage holin family protein [Jeotgalibaca sp. MA1X17-3]